MIVFSLTCFIHQDNDGYTALRSAIKFSKRNRDPTKKEDFEVIVKV